MSDLIERQSILDVLGEYVFYSKKDKAFMDSIVEDIKRVPSTEPKKGKWKKVIDEPWLWYECSECGKKPLWNEWGTKGYFSQFCPHCGAKMEETE